MATLKKIYSDLDLKFDRQPLNGDVSMVYDNRSVINSLKNLLLTNFYERLWQPDLGSNLSLLLFEPVDPLTALSIEKEIGLVIKNFEPRITVESIKVDPSYDENGYNITLSFFVGNNTSLTQVEVFLERNR